MRLESRLSYGDPQNDETHLLMEKCHVSQKAAEIILTCMNDFQLNNTLSFI